MDPMNKELKVALALHELSNENIGTKQAHHGQCLSMGRRGEMKLKMCVGPWSSQEAVNRQPDAGK